MAGFDMSTDGTNQGAEHVLSDNQIGKSHHENPAPYDNAGALFVLESKGTWAHAGYHLTTATAGPFLLSLPFALAGIGWVPGILCLCVGAVVTFYGCRLLSLVMEHMDQQGKRSLRYRDLSKHIIGQQWTYFLLAPLQFTVCFMAVVVSILLGGQAIKAIYLQVTPEGHIKLYEFLIMFGSLVLILSQLPSFHSLRYFNLLSILLSLGFSLCAVSGSIIAGHSKQAPAKDYTILGTPIQKIFAAFNSISIMITTYANPLIVEIQATVAPPVQGKMLKGLVICYTVAVSTYFSVAISGYWAFGNSSQGIIFTNMFTPGTVELVPEWLYIMGNAFVFLQLVIIAVLYLQPTFEKYEGMVADAKKGRFSLRNSLPRLLGRSLFVAIATFLAALLPFFADFSALIGALGLTPICIVLPLLFYNLILKHKSQRLTIWVNYVVMAAGLVVVVVGGIASIHQIVVDARTYSLFANV